LGSPRVITSTNQEVRGRHDYLPFGEELFAGTGARNSQQNYGADNLRQKFTGKERDLEWGLDFFVARYYSAVQARFISADSFGGNPYNPQALNRYSYVLNNPLKLTDPTGYFPALNQIGKYQDPATVPPAKKDGDPFPVASCNGCGSPFGKIAEITSGFNPVDETPISTIDADPGAVSLTPKALQAGLGGDFGTAVLGEWQNGTDPPDFEHDVHYPHPSAQPDFIQFAFSVPFNPLKVTGFDFSLTRTRDGMWFFGLGSSIGLAWPGFAPSLTMGSTFNDDGSRAQGEGQVNSVVGGESANFKACLLMCFGASQNHTLGLPIGGSTVQTGIGPPQVSVGNGGNIKIPYIKF